MLDLTVVILNNDHTSLSLQVFIRLKRYTQHPEFNPEAVGKISVACKSMCQWILALEHYAEVYMIVQPKQKRCEEAQASLAIAQENLQQKQVCEDIIDHHSYTHNFLQV